jgi:hypothetical protein
MLQQQRDKTMRIPSSIYDALRNASAQLLAMLSFLGCAHAADLSDASQASSNIGKPNHTGAGTAGSKYTKVSNDGTDLPESASLGGNATDWACTRDKVTGLLWEVKTSSGLRSQDHFYTWYNGDPKTNAGSVGVISGGECHSTGRCDTEKFVTDVNSTTLCGFSDWRLPTKRELQTLVLADTNNPSIDTKYFPNTNEFGYWSSSSYDQNPDLAWSIYFTYGYPYFYGKLNDYCVRLVRGG